MPTPSGSRCRGNEVKERRGFIALGKLHDYAEQVVFRHEQTLSKPKSDRLNLLKATRAHFGQIFMLYSDPAASVEQILFDGTGPADAEVTDEYGVVHRVWRVNDPAVIRLLVTEMADRKLIIADGHHRYETALAYSKEHAPAAQPRTESSVSQLPHPAYPEAAVMMTFVNMDSEGLLILPTHRVVHSLLRGFDPVGFRAPRKSSSSSRNCRNGSGSLYPHIKATASTAFVAITRNGTWLLMRKNGMAASMLKIAGAPASVGSERFAYDRAGATPGTGS